MAKWGKEMRGLVQLLWLLQNTPLPLQRVWDFSKSGQTDAMLWKRSQVVSAELLSFWCLWVELRLQWRNRVVHRSAEQLWPFGCPWFELTLGIMMERQQSLKPGLHFQQNVESEGKSLEQMAAAAKTPEQELWWQLSWDHDLPLLNPAPPFAGAAVNVLPGLSYHGCSHTSCWADSPKFTSFGDETERIVYKHTQITAPPKKRNILFPEIMQPHHSHRLTFIIK